MDETSLRLWKRASLSGQIIPFARGGALEQILIDMNRGGFPWARESDSPYWLGMEASMDGSATFDGSA